MNNHQAETLMGVRGNYTAADVRAAFKRAAKQHHPDRGGDRATFQRLEQARTCLLAHLERTQDPPSSNGGHEWKYTRAAAVADMFSAGGWADGPSTTHAGPLIDDLTDTSGWAWDPDPRREPEPEPEPDTRFREAHERAREARRFREARERAREARRNARRNLGAWSQVYAVAKGNGELVLLNLPEGCAINIRPDGLVDLILHAGTDRATRAQVHRDGTIERTT